jgi:hypothetical protein
MTEWITNTEIITSLCQVPDKDVYRFTILLVGICAQRSRRREVDAAARAFVDSVHDLAGEDITRWAKGNADHHSAPSPGG